MNSFNNLPLLQDVDLKDKVVLVRVDHNVVKKGLIHDPYRIESTLSTLYHIVSHGGKLILMSHVGRPKDKKAGVINIGFESSVEPIVKYFENKLNVKFFIPEFPKNGDKGYDGIDSSINKHIEDLRSGRIDGIYLPNTRWFWGEEAKDEQADKFAQQLASLADIYVNDAFGSWQAHASTVGITKYLPSYAGYLLQKEILNLDRIFSPQHPFVAVVAGSKFDTKIDSLFTLLEKSDFLILGGVIYNAYLCAKYGIEIKGVESDDIEHAQRFVEFASKYPGKLVELPFIVESDSIEGRFEGQYRTHDIRNLKKGTRLNYVLDAAPESFEDKNVLDVFNNAKTIFVNAVMGLTPYFNDGTIALDTLIDKNKEAMKLYGGGDTMQEFKRLLPGLYIKAVDDPKYYIFTGGGAVLTAIEQGTAYGLEPVKALLNNKV